MGAASNVMGQVGGVNMGQPTSSGINGIPQPTAQPGAKGGTGTNVPTSTAPGGKGGSSVTGGQAANTNYPAYNPQQNTFGALGSTNVYNPVSANNQQPQFPQSTLQLPQGGFQPNTGMYNQPPMPQPFNPNQANINYAPQQGGMMGGQMDPAYQAYAKALQGTPAGQMPPKQMPPEMMAQIQQQQQDFAKMNPQQQQAAMGSKGGMQADPRVMSSISPQQGGMGQIGNPQQGGTPGLVGTPSSPQELQQLSAMLRGLPQNAGQMPQQTIGQSPLQAVSQQLRGLPQNAGQMPKPPMQQQIAQPNQRELLQRMMQQFRPGMGQNKGMM
jgi:hypothetical protein